MSGPVRQRRPRFRVCARLVFCALTALPAPAAMRAEDWPPGEPVPFVPQPLPPGSLPASVRAEPVAPGRWRCTFLWTGGPDVRHVALAGTFNGWNPSAAPMRDEDGDGTWQTTVELTEGAWQYKFVINGQQWRPDPQNPRRVPDGFSGYNSVLELGAPGAAEAPAERGDGRVDAAALAHDPQQAMYCWHAAPDVLRLRYRTRSGDVQAVEVTLRGGPRQAMEVVHRGPRHEYWEARVALPAGPEAVEYTFLLHDGERLMRDRATYRAQRSAAAFDVPDWAQDAVWYQIMPDRFRNGDPSNDPQPVRPWTSAWFRLSPWEQESGCSFYECANRRFYGGDLAGLEEKLGYLRELGVNAIYLNPVFQAESYHRYNATTHVHVDDRLGVPGGWPQAAQAEDLTDPSTWTWTESDRRFLRFLDAAHRAGMRVIIDGVFNHVGVQHPAFQDVLRHGRASRYADWFEITSWDPLRYRGWAGFAELPVFRKSPEGLASAQVRAHIFAVTRRWMDPDGDGDPRDGVDGWRLDVPNEIPAPFWRQWRRLVKQINPEAYICGEIWDRADSWLDGRHFDAVMNYPFARAVVAWVMHRQRKITVSELDRRLAELRLAYPEPATRALQNLLDSHDTDRLVSMALNPDREYDRRNRPQDDNPDYDNSKPPPEAYARARLAVLVQMTYVGAPMIYYGDEAGMWGADDPTCRKPMLWKDLEPYEDPHENFVMQDHLDFYRRVIALRHAHPALRRGSFRTLLCDDAADVWVFLRSWRDEHVLVALNASAQPQPVRVPLPEQLPAAWETVFPAPATVRAVAQSLPLRVPAVGGLVLRAQSASD